MAPRPFPGSTSDESPPPDSLPPVKWESNYKGISANTLIGIIIGGICGVLLIFFIGCQISKWVKKRNLKKLAQQDSNVNMTDPAGQTYSAPSQQDRASLDSTIEMSSRPVDQGLGQPERGPVHFGADTRYYGASGQQ